VGAVTHVTGERLNLNSPVTRAIARSEKRKSTTRAARSIGATNASRANGPIIMPTYRNLLRRPVRPALGNGRVQRGVERALIAHNGGPITTGTAAEWAYALHVYQDKRHRGGRRLASQHYVYLRRALARIADRVGHGRGPGRPWLWRLRDE
jgi:hypothetical protein